VCAAVDEDLLDARIGEKLEGVFDERGVREGQQTLHNRQSDIRQVWQGRLCRHTLGRSSVKGLKRVSKGSASIYIVSFCAAVQVRHNSYHSLQRILTFLLARLALVLALLSFGRHGWLSVTSSFGGGGSGAGVRKSWRA
jgi:hypothetical protein